MRKFLLLPLIMAVCAFTACSDKNTDSETPIDGIVVGGDKDNIVFETGISMVKITLTTTASWSIDVEDTRASSWCNVIPMEGEAGETEISISVNQNISLDDRTAEILVVSGENEKTIAVTQRTSIPASESSRRVDSLALVKLYEATDGDNWENNSGWKTESIDEWHGVSFEDGRVTGLSLSNNNLNGTLPAEITRLAKATYIIAASNNLSGELPSDLNKITGLYAIDVSFNKFSGSIPPDFANFAEITVIRLDHNELTGTIPTGLHNLDKLRTFNMASNKLSGSVPSELIENGPFILGPQNETSFDNYDWGVNSQFPELIGEKQFKITKSLNASTYQTPVWIVQDTQNADILLVKGLEFPDPLRLRVETEGANYKINIDLPQIGTIKYWYVFNRVFWNTKYQYFNMTLPPDDTSYIMSGTTAKNNIEINFSGAIIGSIYDSEGVWGGYMPTVSTYEGHLWITD